MPTQVERTDPRHEDLQRRAYELYEQRGRADGYDWDDWLQAEREIRGAEAAGNVTATAAPRPPSSRGTGN
jgi:hypothetical protein